MGLRRRKNSVGLELLNLMSFEWLSWLAARPGIVLADMLLKKDELKPVLMILCSLTLSLEKIFFGSYSIMGLAVGVILGLVQVAVHGILILVLPYAFPVMISDIITGFILVLMGS